MKSDFFIGVDVSKETFSIAGIDGGGTKLFNASYVMDSSGFAEFIKAIKAHVSDLQQAVVGMESTGCYHINLFSFLVSEGIDAVVINPLLIANFAKLSLRKTKTDRKDATTIARFLLAHRDSVCRMAVPMDIQEMRDLSRERESLCHMMAATKTEIKRVLRATFPELEGLCAVDTQVMLHFLQEFPSARLVKAAKPKAIQKALQRKGVGTRLTYTADDIIRAAHNSVAIISPAKELILSGKIATLEHFEQRYNELTKLLTDLCKAKMIEDFRIVTSIKGVNKKTAVPFLVEIGNIGNFNSCKQLVAYAGLDPAVHQSGKFVGTSKLSKRGNRHLRRVIYLMVRCAVQRRGVFRDYFLKRKKEGLEPQKALFATAHKLLRVLFAMLTQRTHYRERQAMCR